MITIKGVTRLIQSHLFYFMDKLTWLWEVVLVFLVGELFMNLIELSECF